VKLAWFWLGIW